MWDIQPGAAGVPGMENTHRNLLTKSRSSEDSDRGWGVAGPPLILLVVSEVGAAVHWWRPVWHTLHTLEFLTPWDAVLHGVSEMTRNWLNFALCVYWLGVLFQSIGFSAFFSQTFTIMSLSAFQEWNITKKFNREQQKTHFDSMISRLLPWQNKSAKENNFLLDAMGLRRYFGRKLIKDSFARHPASFPPQVQTNW